MVLYANGATRVPGKVAAVYTPQRITTVEVPKYASDASTLLLLHHLANTVLVFNMSHLRNFIGLAVAVGFGVWNGKALL